MNPVKIKVYSGLSLSRNKAEKILPGICFQGPVKRDDLHRDLREGFHVIAIVDGEFMQNLAVSPSEILDLLRCGVKVYGSSSMGAMRAVELEPFGMVGVGEIFQQIKRSSYFEDDLLGQIIFEGKGATVPFIDFKIAIEEKLLKKRISEREARSLIQMYKEKHFSERNLESVIWELSHATNNSKRAIKVLNEIQNKKFYQKSRDAIALLRQIRMDLRRLNIVKSRHAL